MQLRQILEKANWAPSGDNSQPWFFKWQDQKLSVFHDSVRAAHPFNPHGVASILALGCLLEAIAVAATEFGFQIRYQLFDFSFGGRDLWAQVQFDRSEKTMDPLVAQLLRRCTDRRLYRGGELKTEMLGGTRMGSVEMHVLSNLPTDLMDYIVEAEQLLWSLPDFLPATLQWVRFSLSAARRSGDGLSWRNMGVKLWELPLMPLIRHFPLSVQMLRPFAGPQHRLRVRQQLQTAAGLICVSALPGQKAEIVTAGRLSMRAWLSLTGFQYGVHPLTLASTICMCSNHGMVSLPEKWRLLFEQGEKILRRSFAIPEGLVPIWMLRTGASTPLPDNSKTFRRPLGDVLL